MLKEFKEFAIKGNLVDIAVAFVMGAAFSKVVAAFTEGMVAPVIGLLTGKDLSKNELVIKEGVAAGVDAAGKVTEAIPAVSIKWGAFVTACIDFIIVAFVMFIIIKALNNLKKKEPAIEVVPEVTSTDKLLIEIRDALKK